jgi:hypothetical protein
MITIEDINVSTAFPVCVEVKVTVSSFAYQTVEKLDFVLVLFSKLMIKLTAGKGR